jgi:hypothetical protein
MGVPRRATAGIEREEHAADGELIGRVQERRCRRVACVTTLPISGPIFHATVRVEARESIGALR